MPTDATSVIQAYWAAANARDWDAFGALLADDVAYEVPQTAERVDGREAYLRFNMEYPGDWRADIERIVGEGASGVSWTSFVVGDERMTGLCFFQLDDDGRIAHIADFWPEPYDPPPGREDLVQRY